MATEKNSLDGLYVDELRDIYNAEKQLTKAIPEMARAADSDKLREGFLEHLEQTKGHVERLEQIFDALGERSIGKRCAGMEGLIEEGSEVMEDYFEGAVKDAALIGATQRVEHYEIAAYGTVIALAELLGETGHVSLLQQTLAEEKQAYERLSELALDINVAANEVPSDEAGSSAKSKRSGRAA